MRAAILMLSLLLCACAEPELVARTQVVVAVYVDPGLASRLTQVDVEVRDENGAEIVSEHRFELDEGDVTLPFSFGVYQASGGADWFMLIARGIDEGGTTLIEYKVIAQFLKGKTGLLPVVLSDKCAGMLCEGQLTESCYGDVGRCVSINRVVPDVRLSDGGVSELDAGSEVAAPVPPSSHGFGSMGGRRTDGTVSVYGDGFELGERRCTADRRYCATASLVP
jgi:hypothetical protein